MKKLSLILTGTALVAAGGLMFAEMQREPMPHNHTPAGHAVHGAASASSNPVAREFQAASDHMHRDMAIAYTGDADVGFMHGMITQHVGAVERARIVLKDGKDPEVRVLAEEVIRAGMRGLRRCALGCKREVTGTLLGSRARAVDWAPAWRLQ